MLSSWAGEHKNLKIAVASNFYSTAQSLVERFHKTHDIKVKVITGSSGKLYAMIKNGAPFDIFFSADDIKTKALIKENLANNPHVYAYGTLALYISFDKNKSWDMDSVLRLLIENQKIKISMANPRHAPYGLAAENWLKENKIYSKIKGQIIKAENVSQSYLFAHSGNTQMGFVSLSHLLQSKIPKDKYIVLPMKNELKQELVVLKRSKKEKEIKLFLDYLKSPNSLNLIRSNGYK